MTEARHRRQQPPRAPRLRPHRRDRRVGHAEGGCQGQGAEGRGPAGDRLRRRRARLPDPDVHRRGGRRRLPRPEEPPLHPGRRPARAQAGDRREDPARQRARGRSPAQVVVTNGGKQAIYEAFATMLDPGDEVIVPAPYWTTYPEAIQLAGGVAVPVLADETQEYKVTVEQLEAARTERTQGAALRLAVQPDRRGLHRRRDPGDRPVGRGPRAVGADRRDLRAPGLRRRRDRLAAGALPRASPTTPSSSTASPRPTR